MSDAYTIRRVTVGPVMTNCYALIEEAGRQAVLVDPGEEAERIIRCLADWEASPAAILLTHGHFDHIGGVNGVKAAFPDIRVYAPEAERPLFEDWRLRCGSPDDEPVVPDVWVRDGEELTLAGATLKVIASPGHTQGSCCYYAEELAVLFAGDTIFFGSYGRYDLPTGSGPTLAKSLEMLLTTLPEEVQVLPGHDRPTTIGREKRVEGFA